MITNKGVTIERTFFWPMNVTLEPVAVRSDQYSRSMNFEHNLIPKEGNLSTIVAVISELRTTTSLY